MNFNQAIDVGAEKRADLIMYKAIGGSVVVGDVAGRAVIANIAGRVGTDLLFAGAAARGKSLYDVDGGHFLVGDVGELAP